MNAALRFFLVATLGALGLTAVPSSAQAARILVVSDSGADVIIATVLSADGHDVTLVTNDFATGNAALRAGLGGRYDAVFWAASGSGYGDAHTDPAVFAALVAFVSAGGRVFVTGYDSVASPTDPLLIEFLGATGSTDVPPSPGAITVDQSTLTVGVIDIRGLVPIPSSGDRDTLTGLGSDTREIVGTPGGGSQWTLRRLGDGEIAYVSNGDGGATTTASWTSTATDGSGVYNAALRNFARAAGRGPAAMGREPAGSPRRARVMWLLTPPSPAVLVGPDRAWLPTSSEMPLALCAGPTCHAVREMRGCQAPECPGTGSLVIADERVSDVSDFPRGRAEWNRERDLCAADSTLAPIAWAFGVHPEPFTAPGRAPRFLRGGNDWLGWELHLGAGVGALPAAGVGVPAFSASLGLRFESSMDDGLDVMVGTIVGFDARVMVLPGVRGQSFDDLGILVGVDPAFSYAFPREAVRIPPVWAWAIPGFGLAVRTDRAPTYYVAWHLDTAVLIDEHVGLEARADVIVLDEWVDGDDVEVLLSIGVGAFFR